MFKKITTIIIILIPILSQYTIGNLPVSLSEILIGTLTIIYVFKQIIKYKCVCIYNIKPYIFFVIYIVLSSIIISTIHCDYLSIVEVLNGVLRVIFYLFSILILIDLLDVKTFFSYYEKIGLVILCILFVQVIIYYSTGIDFKIRIPFLNLFLNKGVDSEIIKNVLFRPSSVFLEPSFYAVFMLPILAYTLVKKDNYIYSLVIIFSMFLSGSSTGIINGVIIILFKLMFEVKINKRKILFFIILTLSGIFILNSYYFNNAFSRLNQIGNNESSYMRLCRGVNIYSQLPLENKIFGVSIGNVAYFINNNNNIHDEFYMNGSKEFMNDIFYILCISGIIGFIAYIVLYIFLLRDSSKYLKVNVIIFFMVSLTSPMITSFTWLFYMFIILTIKKSEKGSLTKLNILLNK